MRSRARAATPAPCSRWAALPMRGASSANSPISRKHAPQEKPWPAQRLDLSDRARGRAAAQCYRATIRVRNILPHSPKLAEVALVASCKCSRNRSWLEGRRAAERTPAVLPEHSRPSPLQLQLAAESLGIFANGPNTSRYACSVRHTFRRLGTVRSSASRYSPGCSRYSFSSSSRPVRHGSAKTQLCSSPVTARSGSGRRRSRFCFDLTWEVGLMSLSRHAVRNPARN